MRIFAGSKTPDALPDGKNVAAIATQLAADAEVTGEIFTLKVDGVALDPSAKLPAGADCVELIEYVNDLDASPALAADADEPSILAVP